MFQHQHQLFPEGSSKEQPPQLHKQQVPEPSPIWGVVAKETVAKEDQWPDLGARHPLKPQEEEEKRLKDEQEAR